MTFYNHIENVRTMAINLTNGEPWHGARDKARVFDSLDAACREYMRLSDENAKLRELIDAAHMSRLLTENENESLRELLIDVSEEVPWSFMDTTKYFMPLRADKLRKLLCRMRELGVEVDA